MGRRAFLIAAITALAACDSSPGTSERDGSTSKSLIAPGAWQSTITIEAFDIPGMPAEAITRMKSAIVQTQQHEFTTCLTPADARRPEGRFFTGNAQCRYDQFAMDGGKIRAAMRCPSGEGMTQVMTMQGTYTRDHYVVRLTMRGEGVSPPVSAMRMRMRVDSRRIGECPPIQG
ncbi:MAG: DUF3617 domain-containing protein [Sphingomicrobium sp.]